MIECVLTNAGFGQPLCSNSETCLFTSDTFGNLWEGCGQTSISYNWITDCWDYPQVGTAPVSQIYCPASAPSCGFLAFQFDDFNTYYNWGCSTVPYSLYVDLISTADAGASQTLVLAGGGTTSLTETAAATETAADTHTSLPAVIASGFGQGTATTEPTQTEQGSSESTSTDVPTIGSHKSKSKTPIAVIVGVIVGGIALIAFLAFLVWFLLHKRRQDAIARQIQNQQQADAATATAFHNNNGISEIAGTMKPMPEQAGAFAPQQQPVYVNGNGNGKLMGQQVTEHSSPTLQSPPPVYGQPNIQVQQRIPLQQQQFPTSPYQSTNYTDPHNQNLQPGNARTSIAPVSPVGTYNSNTTELGGSNTYQQSPSPSIVQTYQPPPNIQEMQQPALPPNAPQQVYHRPLHVQEMSGNATYQQQPVAQQGYQPPTNIQEMSGGAAPVRPMRQNDGFDMSGAPMSENYGHHELE